MSLVLLLAKSILTVALPFPISVFLERLFWSLPKMLLLLLKGPAEPSGLSSYVASMTKAFWLAQCCYSILFHTPYFEIPIDSEDLTKMVKSHVPTQYILHNLKHYQNQEFDNIIACAGAFNLPYVGPTSPHVIASRIYIVTDSIQSRKQKAV